LTLEVIKQKLQNVANDLQIAFGTLEALPSSLPALILEDVTLDERFETGGLLRQDFTITFLLLPAQENDAEVKSAVWSEFLGFGGILRIKYYINPPFEGPLANRYLITFSTEEVF